MGPTWQIRYALHVGRGSSAKVTPHSCARSAAQWKSAGANSAAIRVSLTNARTAVLSDLEVFGMAQIVSEYDLLPEGTEIDLNKIVETIPTVIPESSKLLETKIIPVAFGLMKIQAGFVIDAECETAGTDLEKALNTISGIQNVECISTTNY